MTKSVEVQSTDGTPTTIPAERIARATHAANNVLRQVIGEDTLPDWDDAEQWMRDSSIESVCAQRAGNLTPREQHEQWMTQRLDAGWTYGPVKDVDAKVSPWLVDYDQLPIEQRAKDLLIAAIVDALS